MHCTTWVRTTMTTCDKNGSGHSSYCDVTHSPGVQVFALTVAPAVASCCWCQMMSTFDTGISTCERSETFIPALSSLW